MNSACVLIPYFGEWPDYFPFYLKGCSANPTFDFHFCTDLPIPDFAVPTNVYFHFYTLFEINAILSEKVGFECAITTPYKLCDIRPAFGIIFSELILPYEFWGWGDIDLVYGQIKTFYDGQDFEKFDVLSGRKKWASGSLFLLRNQQLHNNLFLQNENYKLIFSKAEHFAFDECNKDWINLSKNMNIDSLPNARKSFTFLVFESNRLGKLLIKFEDIIKESISTGWYIHYANGSITDHEGKEFMLFHYVMVKRNPWFYVPSWLVVPDEFYITTTGFYTVTQFHSVWLPFRSFWRKVRVCHIWVTQLVERVVNKIKRIRK